MRKEYIYLLALLALLSSCKETYVSVLKPWNSNYPDSERPPTIDSELPCMALITDKAIPPLCGRGKRKEEAGGSLT